MIKRQLQFLKQRILSRLQERGWYRHAKEQNTFLGITIFATRGAFFRKHEKDDAWLYLLARNHHNIIDVGCNIGQSSMLMVIGTENRIICVDPNPRALAMCAENLIYNGLSSQVNFVNAFVGEDEGKEIKFFTIGAGAAGSMFSGFAKTASHHNTFINVKTRTIDSICKQLAFTPDLIKIDVEGAEQFVLRGIGESLVKIKPAIFVEMHSGVELGIEENTRIVLAWCKQNEYQPFYLKNNAILSDPAIVSKRGRYHLLLLADGVDYPEYLKNVAENSTLSSLGLK
jgi:FkbM family methyltransferase